MANEVQADQLIIEWSGATVGGSTSYDLTIGSENVDVTTFDDPDWSQNKAGMKNWSGTIGGIYQFGTDNQFMQFVEHLINNDNVAVTVAFKASESGEKYVTGSALIDSVDFSGSLKDPVEWSLSFTGTGGLTIATAS